MSKATPNFRKTDLTRALLAAQAAGLIIDTVNVDSKGGFALKIKHEQKGERDDGKTSVEAATG
jgi:hypothetical protein